MKPVEVNWDKIPARISTSVGYGRFGLPGTQSLKLLDSAPWENFETYIGEEVA